MAESIPARPLPRLVRTIYTVRVVAFLWCFATISLHIWDRMFGPSLWFAALLFFLVYPHLAYLRSSRSREPRRVEMQHLFFDAFALGAWIPALEFPLWIALPFVAAPILNGIANRGMQGFMLTVAASCAGMLAGLMLSGYAASPMTGPVVTALCFLGTLCYGAGVGYVLYAQTRRMAEARATLRDSEHRYRLIAEHAGDLVAMVDRDGRWLYTSPSYARILSAENLAPGRDAFARLHEEDQFRVRSAVQVVVRTGESCRLRLRLLTSDGTVRRFEALVQPVREEGGGGAQSTITGAESTITGAVMASRDVTELSDREEQLDIAAHAFERMAEGMVITNAAGRILNVNRSYARITGYESTEVLGRHESEFRTAMQPRMFWDDLYAEVLREGYWTGTVWCRRRDGNIYREWRSVSAVRDAEGRITHFVSLFRELNGHGNDARPRADLPERPAKSA